MGRRSENGPSGSALVRRRLRSDTKFVPGSVAGSAVQFRVRIGIGVVRFG